MLNELEKNGLSINILNEISYKSSLGKNLKNSLRKFSKEELFDEVRTMIQCGRILNEHDFEEVLKHVLSSSKEI